MWGRRQRKQVDEPKPTKSPGRLKEALRKARVEQADRTGVVVDLHDAEIARLELSAMLSIRCSSRSPPRSICSIAG